MELKRGKKIFPNEPKYDLANLKQSNSQLPRFNFRDEVR